VPSDQPAGPRRLTVRSSGVPLAALLFLPAGAPRGGLLVCHGAGSTKENHAVMAEQAVAAGLAALVFDFRGHGDSGGVMDDGGADDVIAAAETLARESGAPWLAARGSSLGAHWLLRAAAERRHLFRALAALCPADEASLLAGLDHFVALAEAGGPGAELSGRFDVDALRRLWRTTDLIETAHGLRGVLLAHARDDEDVPFAVSERLAAVLAPPTRLIALDGGGHKGPQRSPEVARATIEWALSCAARPDRQPAGGR
jgi:dienelactone hydrolase